MSEFVTERILGIAFFTGTAEKAVAEMSQKGGLLVAPSGTCFERFLEDEEYRTAIITADITLPDSGLMVSLWRLLRRRRINRVSGLAYIKALLRTQSYEPANTFWVMPNERSRAKLAAWSVSENQPIATKHIYVAPMYGTRVEDVALLQLLEERQPKHVIIGIGAGPQEKLGWYVRESLSYRIAIHCIGGALGFVTGDQVAIPDWADRLYLGWFLRLLSQPRVFVPRLWRARILPGLMERYGAELPPLKSKR